MVYLSGQFNSGIPCHEDFTAAPIHDDHRTQLGVLLEQHAVTECEHHGHRRDRSDPDAWNRAREEAWRNPFPGATPEACIAAMEDIMRSIGDSCPDC